MPGDISVTGFDNIDDAARGIPPLTTVHVPKEAMGRAAVEKLLSRINSPSAPLEKILIAADIVHRDSVGSCGVKRKYRKAGKGMYGNKEECQKDNLF